MDDQELKNRVVRKMLRKRVVGGHKKQIDTIVNVSLPSHERGRGRRAIEGMIADPAAPIEAYGGGHRQNVRLTSVSDAVEYLKDNGGDVPFGFG